MDRQAESSRHSPLYKVLYEGLEDYRSNVNEGVLDCRKLGKALKISDKAIYRWFERKFIPPRQVKKLLALSNSTLELENLLPFVIDR